MDWWVILILLTATPIILFPIVFVWYLNVGGLYAAIKEAPKRRAALRERMKAQAEAK